MKNFLYIFLTYFISSNALANQPKDWQLGFQEAASSSMREIVNFHDKLLLPIIIAISVFVLFFTNNLRFILSSSSKRIGL